MNKLIVLLATALFTLQAEAQTLSLDSCRAMALRSNKQLGLARLQQDMAANMRKAARTKYLPHIEAVAGWALTSKELSLLSDENKDHLRNLGTTSVMSMQGMGSNISQAITGLASTGDIKPATAQVLGQIMQQAPQQLAAFGNAMGDRLVQELRTDTRSMFAGSIMLTQPLYMGGAITAANRMAEISESMAGHQITAAEREILFTTDQAYWMVVSLTHKQKLAEEYLTLVQKLSRDVTKMIENGVATRADGLKVDVRVNEAEMTKTQVDNGLALAKMYLCQLCGMPLESTITLTDEQSETLTATTPLPAYDKEAAIEQRPELQLLASAVKLSEASTKLVRASRLPQLALTGGYLISNPNVYNGYANRFGGVWNVGLMLHVPVFDWGEGMYRVRAAKATTNIARLQLDEAREKINLQVAQCSFKLSEAGKKLTTAQKNIQRAEENLRCANLGFKEGVMQTTDVMAAQTAWLQAKTQHIDAEIEVRISETGMRKALASPL